MKTMSISTVLAIIIFSSFLYENAESTAETEFQKCFTESTYNRGSNIPEIFHAPNDPLSFDKYFKSSIQNVRFSNSTTVKKPSFIITPKEETHVQAAVICARQSKLKVRARSGGHDYEGLSYISLKSYSFILIDLASLINKNGQMIDVNVEQGTAWVNAGATNGQLCYKIAQASDTLAFPTGLCPTIGIGGMLSGGGIGTLMRKYGLSADNIVDALIVDSNGRILDRKKMGEDNFWAIRGGGSGFGVILKFKISLVKVPKMVTTINVTRTLEQNGTALLAKWESIAPRFDDNLFIRVLALPKHEVKTVRLQFEGLFLGRMKELLGMMKKEFPELEAEEKDCKEVSWINSVLDFGRLGDNKEALNTRGAGVTSYKGMSDFVKKPISAKGWEEIWSFLLKKGEGIPLQMIMDPMGGIFDRIKADAIPFPHRKGNLYNIQYFLRWAGNDEKANEKRLDWMRKLYAFMTPYVSKNPRGTYINYKDLGIGWNSQGEASYEQAKVWGQKYYLDNFKRLASVKKQVDSQNVFWDELSIPST